ncbi:cytochrome P450 [Nocardia sp. XZ_19_385]|uniref:cytochrome P450 family protein n=1 Tax=Nocardia sp. XZ_19_385 TaxID=2769488 RepID=UPI00188FD4A4|nr:cytochrome P450 [Nocardia sp. XZ_19_385]
MNAPCPFDTAYLTNPHPVHVALRESGAVHRIALPDGAEVWLLTRETDIRQALTDPRLSVDRQHSRGGYTGFNLPPALDANLLNRDGSTHRRLRRHAARAFTPRRVEGLRASIQAETDRLLSLIADQDEVDLIETFAVPLPLTVIGDLLGIPEDFRERFRAGTNALVMPDPTRPQRIVDAITQIEEFLQELVIDKRSNPTDDFLSDLVAQAHTDDSIDDVQLVSLAFLIFWAGYENPVNLIGKAVLALLEHPHQLTLVRRGPALSDAAIEELLRFAHGSQYAIRRFATEALTIGGVEIPAGDTVMLGLASANRDPRFTAAPDDLDLTRRNGDTHLAFGHGPHYCLGAPLARLEIRVAIESLLTRFPHIQLTVPVRDLRWRPSFREHGLISLPVSTTGSGPAPARKGAKR